jgi:ABC-2 type transport system ATP-binding protein
LSHVRGLIASEGIGVLWATHLIDEVRDGDDVVVLHRGKVLDKGEVAAVCARAGAPTISAAFNRLAGVDAAEGH